MSLNWTAVTLLIVMDPNEENAVGIYGEAH
jgi:hypothetical protein